MRLSSYKGRTIRKVMGGGGGRGIFSLHEFFFFCSLPVQEFFWGVKPSARNFFAGKYCFFFSVKSRFIIIIIIIKTLFYEGNTK